jgi:hypothetical protein
MQRQSRLQLAAPSGRQITYESSNDQSIGRQHCLVRGWFDYYQLASVPPLARDAIGRWRNQISAADDAHELASSIRLKLVGCSVIVPVRKRHAALCCAAQFLLVLVASLLLVCLDKLAERIGINPRLSTHRKVPFTA